MSTGPGAPEIPPTGHAVAFDIIREALTTTLTEELQLDSKDRDFIIKQIEKIRGGHASIVLCLVRAPRRHEDNEPPLPFHNGGNMFDDN